MCRVDHQMGAIKKGFSESRSNVKFSFATQVIGRTVLQFISSHLGCFYQACLTLMQLTNNTDLC